MLRTLRRLLRPGGRMAFYTIHLAPGLGASAQRRGRAAGPPALGSRRELGALVVAAGFDGVVTGDVTAAFRATQLDWFSHWARHADSLRRTLTEGLYEERQAERRHTLAAIDEGLLQRSLVVAVRRQHRVRS